MSCPEPDTLTLQWLPGRYAVCRFGANDALPAWAAKQLHPPISESGAMAEAADKDKALPCLFVVVRTECELSIVIDERAVLPSNEDDNQMQVQRGFGALRIAGTLDFSLVGILAKLTNALAEASVPVFAVSTFDTDILLVPSHRAGDAAEALRTVANVQGELPID